MTDNLLILEIARTFYGATPEMARLASFNNDVYLLTFAGDLPDKVIKMTKPGGTEDSLRREQYALRLLGNLGLSVPAIEGTQEEYPAPARAFTLMPRMPGVALNQSIALSPEWAQSAWENAGRFAAQIGHLGADVLPQLERPRSALGPDDVRRAFDFHSLLRPPFTHILDEAEPLLTREQSFIHGDYGAGQIIADDAHFAVIDWESAGPGSPLEMLGRIVAMTREYDRHYGGNGQRIAWLMAGYASITPWTDQTRHELHIWEMYNHLGVMAWKLGWLGEHDDHARAMVGRVEEWTYLGLTYETSNGESSENLVGTARARLPGEMPHSH